MAASIPIWTVEYRVFSGDGRCLLASEPHRAGTEITVPRRVWFVVRGGDYRPCRQPELGQSLPIPYGVAAAVIVVGLVGSEQRGLISVPAIFQSLGAASYSIYLFHLPFITLVWVFWLEAGLDRSMTPTASFLPLAIGGVGGGMLMSRLVEFPLMRLLRGGLSRIRLSRHRRGIRRSPEVEGWTMCHDHRPAP